MCSLSLSSLAAVTSRLEQTDGRGGEGRPMEEGWGVAGKEEEGCSRQGRDGGGGGKQTAFGWGVGGSCEEGPANRFLNYIQISVPGPRQIKLIK